MCTSDFKLNHEKFMRAALEEAQKAFEAGEIPVGAVIVKDGKIISRGCNTRETQLNSIGHAEMNAIQKACLALKSWRLDDCELYVTLEPCPMCTGAIITSRIKRVVYGASDDKQGCLGSVCNMAAMQFPTVPMVRSGVLENECENILKKFFEKIRKKS